MLPTDLPPSVRALLAGLRWRIRAYVLLEGLLAGVAWLAFMFWVSLALDYGPVLLGASELPWGARLALLIGVGLVFAVIMYRWILNRAFTRLPDRSLALLLERRFQGFRDSLVTSVELAEKPTGHGAVNAAMFAHTVSDAQGNLGEARPGRVFNPFPLLVCLLLAVVLTAPLPLFAGLFPKSFRLGAGRVYLLTDAPWPRNAEIAVHGLEVARSQALGDVGAETRPFVDNKLKVAQGADCVLHVRAEARGHVVPSVCTIYYRTADGDRGRANMQTVGRVTREGFQAYRFDGRPFQGVLSNIRFDVVGFDHRVRNFEVEVVENPAVVETKLDCEFPSYLVDPKLALWLPRTIDFTSNLQLPRGTKVRLRATANKPLKHVYIHHAGADRVDKIDIGGAGEDARRFSHDVPALEDNLALEIILHDVDDVISETPHRVFVTAVEDQPPQVQLALRGIGEAVTPDVNMPFGGEVKDDYRVNAAWFELEVGDLFRRHEVALLPGDKIDSAIDFQKKARETAESALQLQPGMVLYATLRAEDRFNLTGAANLGASERFELRVVTPDELLRLLEVREAGLRKRLEQIIDETREARDGLARIGSADLRSDAGAEPGEKPADAAPPGAEPGETDPALSAKQIADRLKTLKLMIAQRAAVQSQKSSREVLGVAASFDDIRLELVNNRVDSEDRKSRLKNEIAEPLRVVGEVMFAELDKRLASLEASVDDRARSEAALRQADAVVIELERVLQKLIKFETYNELVDLLRELIADQETVKTQTQEERKRQFKRDLLEDLK